MLKDLNVQTFHWPEGIEVTCRVADNGKKFVFVLNANFNDTSVLLDKSYTNALSGEKVSGEVIIPRLDVLVLTEEV